MLMFAFKLTNMKIKKNYACPSIQKIFIDKDTSLVMCSPLVSATPFKLFRFLR